jgi:pimeloyl-[acyl-carrier protein] methyl ester esterase
MMPGKDKPHLLLLSGWAHPANVFDPLLHKLGGAYRTYALALPELRTYFEYRVQSSLVRNSYSSPYARALINYIGERKVNVLGYSMGGMIALEAASVAPHIFNKVVIVSSFPRFTATDEYAVGAPLELLRSLRDQFRCAPGEALARFFQLCALPGKISVERQSEKIHCAVTLGVQELDSELDYLQSADISQALPDIENPVLILHGRNDSVVSCKAAEILSSALPSARKIIFPLVGHNIIEQAPMDLAREIKKFLR